MVWSGYVFSLMLADTDTQLNSTSLKSYNIFNIGIHFLGSYSIFVSMHINKYKYKYIYWSIFDLLNTQLYGKFEPETREKHICLVIYCIYIYIYIYVCV